MRLTPILSTLLLASVPVVFLAACGERQSSLNGTEDPAEVALFPDSLPGGTSAIDSGKLVAVVPEPPAAPSEGSGKTEVPDASGDTGSKTPADSTASTTEVPPVAEGTEPPAVVPPAAEIPQPPAEVPEKPAVLPPVAEVPEAPAVVPPVAEVPETPAVVPPAPEEPKSPIVTPPPAEVPETPVVLPPVAEVPQLPVVTPPVPALPVSTNAANAALAARMGVPEAAVFLNSDFESEDAACWNNRSGGFARAGCGPFKSIGSYPIALSTSGISHSGSKALRITYAVNEEAGGSNVGVYADTINVRAYYYFDQGFDFGQGMKIGRVQSFNSQTQMNDVDVILQCRSVNGANQCGMTDMYQLGLHYNGRPLGSDWGAVSANVSFERGRWYAVEYQVIMNTPGVANGVGRMWVDGRMVGERKDLRIRGSLGTNVKLNTVKVGGWYSNGGGGNSCANPSQPSRIYMDDVAIAKGYIGLK